MDEQLHHNMFFYCNHCGQRTSNLEALCDDCIASRERLGDRQHIVTPHYCTACGAPLDTSNRFFCRKDQI